MSNDNNEAKMPETFLIVSSWRRRIDENGIKVKWSKRNLLMVQMGSGEHNLNSEWR